MENDRFEEMVLQQLDRLNNRLLILRPNLIKINAQK